MRSRLPDRGAVVAMALGGLLVFGLLSLRLVPFYEPLWGLDLQNVYAYQTCPEARESGLYAVSGSVCADEVDRPFIYPPALFHAFFWVEWFTFDEVVSIWNGMMVVAMLGVGLGWLALDGRLKAGWRTACLAVFWLLLLAQFPFVFALERGNNDVVPVVLWTGAAAVFVWRRFAISGALAGAAVALKVYPVVAVGVVAFGALLARWRVALFFAAGCVGGGLVASVLWWDETVHYVTVVLPEFVDTRYHIEIFSHALRADGVPSPAGVLFGGALLGSWTVAAWRRMTTSPPIVFAGALAISTYFASTSWDYNLVTAYPLLLLVASRALDPARSLAWRVVALWAVLAIAAGREVFSPWGQLLAQVTVLIAIAWLVALDHGEGRTSSRPLQRDEVVV